MTTKKASQVVNENAADHVNYFCLASWKGACKLEKVGLKSSGGAIRPRIAERLGLKPRDSFDTFVARIQELMDEILKEKAEKHLGATSEAV